MCIFRLCLPKEEKERNYTLQYRDEFDIKITEHEWRNLDVDKLNENINGNRWRDPLEIAYAALQEIEHES